MHSHRTTEGCLLDTDGKLSAKTRHILTISKITALSSKFNYLLSPFQNIQIFVLL